MWRAYFYEKSWVGRWVYKPLATALWIGVLGGIASTHVQTGALQPWALSLIGLGFVLFLGVKLHMIRQGKVISFGADIINGSPWYIAACYITGYGLMIAGFMLSFA
jgi:hypothetical protein